MTTAAQGFEDASGFFGRIPQSNIGEDDKLGRLFGGLISMTTAAQGFQVAFRFASFCPCPIIFTIHGSMDLDEICIA